VRLEGGELGGPGSLNLCLPRNRIRIETGYWLDQKRQKREGKGKIRLTRPSGGPVNEEPESCGVP
jgi:hypothetical protein